jgi:hypothetical protein
MTLPRLGASARLVLDEQRSRRPGDWPRSLWRSLPTRSSVACAAGTSRPRETIHLLIRRIAIELLKLMDADVDPGWLRRACVEGSPYSAQPDLLVRTCELPAAIETARRHPETAFVLDHGAKRPPDDAEWAERVAELAGPSNVARPLSVELEMESRRRAPQSGRRCRIELPGSPSLQRCRFGAVHGRTGWIYWTSPTTHSAWLTQMRRMRRRPVRIAPRRSAVRARLAPLRARP